MVTDLEKLEQLLEDFKIESVTSTYGNTIDIVIHQGHDEDAYEAAFFIFTKDGKFIKIEAGD